MIQNVPEIPLSHSSARPTALQSALWTALESGRVPGKWLYQSEDQARRWLAYHDAWSPSRAEASLLRLYQGAFRETAHRFDSAPVQVVGLGCGGGRKDAMMLKEFISAGMPVADGRHEGNSPDGSLAATYVPLDVSPTLVAQAAQEAAAQAPGVAVRPIVADLEALPELVELLPGGLETPLPRVLTCFGMLPNFSHSAFPAYLAGLLRPGDRVLLSANLSPGAGWPGDGEFILPQYDNPAARNWYAGALEALNVKQEQFGLEVAGHGLQPDGEVWQVLVTARFVEPVTLETGGRRMSWPREEPLQLFFSNRFTAAAAPKVLGRAGLTVDQAWIHDSGEEGIYLCSV